MIEARDEALVTSLDEDVLACLRAPMQPPETAQRLLRLSKNTTYRALAVDTGEPVADGKIPAIRIGAQWRIRSAWLLQQVGLSAAEQTRLRARVLAEERARQAPRHAALEAA